MRKTTQSPAAQLMLAALVGLAAAIALVVASPSPASADPVCAGASVTGTATGDHHVDKCVPHSAGVLCTRQRAGIDPTVLVEVRACAPLPWLEGQS